MVCSYHSNFLVPMSSGSNGFSSPCKSNVDGEVMGSIPTRCVTDAGASQLSFHFQYAADS